MRGNYYFFYLTYYFQCIAAPGYGAIGQLDAPLPCKEPLYQNGHEGVDLPKDEIPNQQAALLNGTALHIEQVNCVGISIAGL